MLWLLVLGITPALVTTVLGHWLMTRAAIHAAGGQLLGVSERTAGEIDQALKEIIRGVSELGTKSPAVWSYVERANERYRGHDPAAADARVETLEKQWQSDSAGMTAQVIADPLSALLREFSRRNPALYEHVLVTDSLGLVVGATAPPSRVCFAGQEWRDAAASGRGSIYISKLHVKARPASAEGDFFLNASAPVLDPASLRPAGVVLIQANVSDLVELLEGVEPGQTGYTALIATPGEVLLSSIPGSLPDPRVVSDRRPQLAVSYPLWYQGRGLARRADFIVAQAPIPSTYSHSPSILGGTNWVVTTEMSKAEVLAPTHHFGRTSIFLVLFTAAMLMVFGLFLSGRITRPLRDLRDGAKRVGAGQLDLRLNLRTGDEIEDLAGEFDAMAEKLQESYRGLEAKIEAATAELAREKNSLQSILTSLGEGLMVVDTDLRVVMWNQAAERMTGFKTEEVIGRPCAGILHTATEKEPNICATGCPVEAAFAQHGPVSRHDMSTYVLSRNGSKVPVSLTASPLFDEEDRARGCVVVLRDITQEKEIDQLKSDMISTVSHELRAPLTPIIGFAEMLQDGSLPSEKRARFLRIIIDESRRLSGLVDNFLTLSRIEAGRFELNLQEVEVRGIVEEVIGMEAGQHPSHELLNQIPADFPLIRADRDRIKRVIYNLITNAVKYSPSGGPVRVRGRDLDGNVEIVVEDQGVGIRRQDLPKLFRRFQRVNREATPHVPGTGLGLSICKNVIQEHGGTISVQSEYGKGSTFTIRLPKAGPPSAPGTETEPAE